MSRQVQHQSKPQPSMPSQRLQTASDRSASFTPATVHKAPQSKAMGLMSALDDKFPELASGVTNEVARVIGADKLKQHRAAVRGDADASPNATRAGRQAFEDVGTRNEASKTGMEMVNFANTFEDMDDGAYEAGISAIVDKLYEEHGTSPGAITAITDMMEGFNEKSELARFGQVQRMEEIAKYQRGVESYHTALSSLTSEDDRKEALLMVMNEVDAMGVATENGLKAFEAAAVSLSIDNKDSTMFEYAKEKGFFNSSPAMQAADAKLTNRLNIDGARDNNNTILDVRDTLVGGNFTREESLDAISKMVDKDGDAIYTQVQQMSMYNSIEAEKARAREVDGKVANILRYSDDEILDHMGRRKKDATLAPISLIDMPSAQQQRIVGALRESYEEDYNIAMAMADDDQERENLTNEHEFSVLTTLMDNGLVDEDLKAQLGVLNQNLNGMEGTVLPDGMRAAFDSVQHLKNHGPAQFAHATDDEIALGFHFQRGLSENLNEVQAAIQAQKIVQEGSYKPADPKERQKIASEVSKAVAAEFEHGFFNLGKPDDISQTQLNRITNKTADRVNGLMALGIPLQDAVVSATKGITTQMHQLPSGHVLDIPLKKLVDIMGMQNAATTQDFISSLPEQMLSLDVGASEDFMLNGATTFTPEEWIPVIQNNRIHFEANGFPITKPMHLSEVGAMARANVAEEAEGQGVAQAQEKKRIKDMFEANTRASKAEVKAIKERKAQAELDEPAKQVTRANWRDFQ